MSGPKGGHPTKEQMMARAEQAAREAAVRARPKMIDRLLVIAEKGTPGLAIQALQQLDRMLAQEPPAAGGAAGGPATAENVHRALVKLAADPAYAGKTVAELAAAGEGTSTLERVRVAVLDTSADRLAEMRPALVDALRKWFAYHIEHASGRDLLRTATHAGLVGAVRPETPPPDADMHGRVPPAGDAATVAAEAPAPTPPAKKPREPYVPARTMHEIAEEGRALHGDVGNGNGHARHPLDRKY